MVVIFLKVEFLQFSTAQFLPIPFPLHQQPPPPRFLLWGGGISELCEVLYFSAFFLSLPLFRSTPLSLSLGQEVEPVDLFWIYPSVRRWSSQEDSEPRISSWFYFSGNCVNK